MSKLATIEKYEVIFSTKFKRQYKKIKRQNKDLDELFNVIDILSKKEKLPTKYKDHLLINDKYYKDCRECHISPDWLLIYQYQDERLVLLLIATGSHSDLFR